MGMLGTPRALPAARVVPDARASRIQVATAIVRSAARAAWRRVQPQALVLTLTGVGVAGVLGLAYLIAVTAYEPVTMRPKRQAVLYVMPAPAELATVELGTEPGPTNLAPTQR